METTPTPRPQDSAVLTFAPRPARPPIQFPRRAGFRPGAVARPLPEPAFETRPVAVLLSDRLPARLGALYYPRSSEIVVSVAAWDAASPGERRALMGHELVHHFTGTVYSPAGQDDVSTARVNRRLEPAIEALGAHLARLPQLGRLLATCGVLSPTDGAWLDAAGEAG